VEKALLQVIPGKEITKLKEVIVLLSEKCNGWRKLVVDCFSVG